MIMLICFGSRDGFRIVLGTLETTDGDQAKSSVAADECFGRQ